jgi:hypothetical protein
MAPPTPNEKLASYLKTTIDCLVELQTQTLLASYSDLPDTTAAQRAIQASVEIMEDLQTAREELNRAGEEYSESEYEEIKHEMEGEVARAVGGLTIILAGIKK